MLNIAVIDDDILALRIFKENLEQIGYECRIFNNQEKAMRSIRDFDVVLLDYHLGRVNGKDILKKIKKIKPEIVVIMISGYIIENVINNELQELLYGFYTKPVDFKKLKEDLDGISASVNN